MLSASGLAVLPAGLLHRDWIRESIKTRIAFSRKDQGHGAVDVSLLGGKKLR